MRKMHRAADGVEYLLAYTPSGYRVTFRDEFPNVGDVLRREGMKVKASAALILANAS
jgi:hypothetical protein